MPCISQEMERYDGWTHPPIGVANEEHGARAVGDGAVAMGCAEAMVSNGETAWASEKSARTAAMPTIKLSCVSCKPVRRTPRTLHFLRHIPTHHKNFLPSGFFSNDAPPAFMHAVRLVNMSLILRRGLITGV